MTAEFEPFPKIARATTDVTITEKIDGTNATIRIVDVNDPDLGGATRHDLLSAQFAFDALGYPPRPITAWVGDCAILAGSRKRWIHPTDDNFGFAAWVFAHCEELVRLGPGVHRGEWWGWGIQRGYGLDHRRFSLFNTHKWGVGAETPPPSCCHVVPVVARTTILTMGSMVDLWERELRANGSAAAPGFMHPEGLMLYLHGPGVFVKHPWSK